MRRRQLLILSVLLGSALLMGVLASRRGGSGWRSSPAASSAPQPIPRVDVHVHMGPKALSQLNELMERYGFDHVVNLSGGHPMLGLPDQIAAARSAGRITVFAGLAYEQAESPGYGQRMAALLRRGYTMGARGLKITKALGLALTGPDGKLVPVDDPELDPVFQLAGELGIPVAIHSGDPRAFWQAVDSKNERYDELKAHPGWALAGRDVPSFHQILDQLEHRIARHPKTNFIAVHFGNDAEEPERVGRMLDKYPNMYVDTAARVPEMGRHDPAKMHAFFIKYQDRILYGSDLGIGPPGTSLFLGSEGEDPPTEREERLFFSATRRYFETADKDFEHPTPIQGKWRISGIYLPDAVLRKVYYQNAAKLLGLDVKQLEEHARRRSADP